MIDKITMKLLGQKVTVYRVLDATGEVLQCFATLAEAQAYAA